MDEETGRDRWRGETQEIKFTTINYFKGVFDSGEAMDLVRVRVYSYLILIFELFK